MRAGPIFLDTGIFIAFLDRSDHYHSAAVHLFADPPRRWYSSLAVVSETYGWFLHRLNEEAARTFRIMLNDFPRLRLLAIDQAHHRAVSRKLDTSRTQADLRGCVEPCLSAGARDSGSLGHRSRPGARRRPCRAAVGSGER